MLIVEVLIFSHLIWLGFYLLGRGLRREPGGFVALATLVLAYAIGQHALIRVMDGESSLERGVWAAIVITLALLASEFAGRFAVGGPGRQQLPILMTQVAVYLAGSIAVVAGYADALESPPVMVPIALATFALGIYAALKDARAKGEPLAPDLFRSYDYSLIFALLFGGQIVLAMLWSTGATQAMVGLLLGTITAAIAVQVFIDPVQDTLDRIAFASFPWLRAERAELRHTASALPRAGLTNPLDMDEETFARLTRRALSNYGDLTKLSGSPLVNLPEIYRRLGPERAPTTVERAAELKLLLAEAIETLKPRTGEEFGTTDEWRFYNALYFPYVVGMRPYSLRATNEFDDPASKSVLNWFQAYVPERTLHNWQNAAAALVAQYLREQEEAAASEPEPVAGGVR